MKYLTTIVLFFFMFIIHAQVSDFMHIDFNKADNIAKIHQGESLQNLPLLSYKLTHKLPTDVEKFRAIYTWVCTNIKGDNNQYNTITKNRKKYRNDSVALLQWNKEYKKKIFKKLIKRKKTMCTGYAYLIKELATLTGIQSEIVDGYGRSVTTNVDSLETLNHSWNAVKLNKKWYLCDATWSSGYMQEGVFIKNYNDGYFLTEPSLFAKNHYPLDKKWLLDVTQTDDSFVNAPLIYGEAFKYNLVSFFPSKMRVKVEKNREIVFKFETLKRIKKDQVQLVLFSVNNIKPLEIYEVKVKEGITKFKYKFKNKGYYDVHLKIGEDIIATYSIKVKES